MRSKAQSGLLVISILLAGCLPVSPDTRFYSLDMQPLVGPPRAPEQALALGLGPILLPDILQRSEIVTLDPGGQLLLAEFDQWGGDLGAAILRGMQAQLRAQFPRARIYAHPWTAYQEVRYQVRVDILQLIGTLGGATRLQGSWSLIGHPERREQLHRRFDFSDRAEAAGYPALVDAYGRMITALGQQIAQVIAASPAMATQ